MTASPFGSVHGLLHSTGFMVARNVVLFVVIVFWLGLAYWVYRDARRRVDDPWLIGTATLLALVVPFIGPVVYMLFRAPETLHDVRARNLEMHALEERLNAHRLHCPVCRGDVDASFVVCPICTTRLKQPCRQCSAALEASWQTCPYCATPVISVPEFVTPDLDTALAAEVAANPTNGSRNGHGRPKRARAAR